MLLTIQALSAPPLPVLPKPVDPFDPSPLASPADLASSAAARRKPSVAVPTSEKALALTAASLAAMDAGSIGLTAVALGACCAVLADGSWVVDPDYDEERSATAVFGVGWAFGAAVGVEAAEDGAGREVVWLESDGDFDEDDVRPPPPLPSPPRLAPLLTPVRPLPFCAVAAAAAARSSTTRSTSRSPPRASCFRRSGR